MNKKIKQFVEWDWSSLVVGAIGLLIIFSSFRGFCLYCIAILLIGELIYGYNLFIMKTSWSVKIKSKKLVTKGFFSYIRHPLFLGVIISFYGLALTFKSIIGIISTTLLIVPYFYYRAKAEEEHLIKKMPEYKKYMRKTGMFFPKLK